MQKAIFLDRDGTLNVDKGYVHKKSDFEYMPGALDALAMLSQKGYLIVIITNQSGIARGYYTEKEYLALTEWLEADMKGKGINVAESFYCPHHPKGIIAKYSYECDCRKPKTGLFWKAKEKFDLDMGSCVAVGDKVRDLEICKETGMKGLLIVSEQQRQEAERRLKNMGFADNVGVICGWEEVGTIPKFV